MAADRSVSRVAISRYIYTGSVLSIMMARTVSGAAIFPRFRRDQEQRYPVITNIWHDLTRDIIFLLWASNFDTGTFKLDSKPVMENCTYIHML